MYDHHAAGGRSKGCNSSVQAGSGSIRAPRRRPSSSSSNERSKMTTGDDGVQHRVRPTLCVLLTVAAENGGKTDLSLRQRAPPLLAVWCLTPSPCMSADALARARPRRVRLAAFAHLRVQTA